MVFAIVVIAFIVTFPEPSVLRFPADAPRESIDIVPVELLLIIPVAAGKVDGNVKVTSAPRPEVV
jgi:hypothetical protein